MQGLLGGKMEPASFLVLQINLAVLVPLRAPFPQIQSPVVVCWTDGNIFVVRCDTHTSQPLA